MNKNIYNERVGNKIPIKESYSHKICFFFVKKKKFEFKINSSIAFRVEYKCESESKDQINCYIFQIEMLGTSSVYQTDLRLGLLFLFFLNLMSNLYPFTVLLQIYKRDHYHPSCYLQFFPLSLSYYHMCVDKKGILIFFLFLSRMKGQFIIAT